MINYTNILLVFSQEGQHGKSQKEEKMEGYQRLVKLHYCLLHFSTSLNCKKTLPSEGSRWMIQWLSQVFISLNNFKIQLYAHFDLSSLHAGAHTLGFSHCSSFEKRIHNFNSTHDIDPTLRPSFASTLKGICPVNNKAKNAGVTMDSSPTKFDTTHYKLIIQRKTLFASDQSLLTTPRTKQLVYRFATSKKAFHTAFAKSMIKMSSLNGGQEIRKDCRVVN